MKVLYFTNSDVLDLDTIPQMIRKLGDEVICISHAIDLDWVKENKIDFIVSDRSRFLIKQDLIEYLPKKIINLHPSFLPWNRGYHPNYWSLKEKTPFGVTIHYIDEGIDTGNLLVQTRLFFNEGDTLKTTYDRLRLAMIGLFEVYWPLIRLGKLPDSPQEKNTGSIHFKKDFEKTFSTLKDGWDTLVIDLK